MVQPLLQKFISRVDESPRYQTTHDVGVGASKHRKNARIALPVQLPEDGAHTVVLPADLHLHLRLDDIQRVEDRADRGAEDTAAREVLERVDDARLRLGEERLEPLAQQEEHGVAEAVAHDDRRHAAVVLADAELVQRPEHGHAVREPLHGRAVLQHRLHALERREDRLGRSGQHRRDGADDVGRRARQAVLEQPREVVVHAEHDGEVRRLLQERRQQAAVERHEAFLAQLPRRRPGRDAMQLLTELDLVDGEREDDIDARGAPPAHELPRVERVLVQTRARPGRHGDWVLLHRVCAPCGCVVRDASRMNNISN